MEAFKDTYWFYFVDKVIIVIILGIFAYRNNRKLEKFKIDLIRGNKVFEDKYIRVKVIIMKFILLQDKFDSVLREVDTFDYSTAQEYPQLSYEESHEEKLDDIFSILKGLKSFIERINLF